MSGCYLIVVMEKFVFDEEDKRVWYVFVDLVSMVLIYVFVGYDVLLKLFLVSIKILFFIFWYDYMMDSDRRVN